MALSNMRSFHVVADLASIVGISNNLEQVIEYKRAPAYSNHGRMYHRRSVVVGATSMNTSFRPVVGNEWTHKKQRISRNVVVFVRVAGAVGRQAVTVPILTGLYSQL